MPPKPTPPATTTTAPTRRGFLALLGGAAAVLAVGLPPEQVRPKSPWVGPTGKPRWIGHF